MARENTKVRSIHCYGAIAVSVQTFKSPNSGPVGFVDPGSVRFVQPAPGNRPKPYSLPAEPPLPRVDIVYTHAGMDASWRKF